MLKLAHRDGRKAVELAAAVTALHMLGYVPGPEAVNAEPAAPATLDDVIAALAKLQTDLTGQITAISDRVSVLEKAGGSGEAVNALKTSHAALATDLKAVQAAMVGVKEAVNAKPASEKEIVLKALQRLYLGKPLLEVVNSIPAGYLREDKIRELIAWDGGSGFDLLNEAFVKKTTAATTNIGVAGVAGLRFSGTAAARAYAPGADSVTLKPIRDFVNAAGNEVEGTDFNVSGDIARMFFDGRQISLAELWAVGTKAGRPEAATETVKGVLTYDLTTTDEAGKLRKIVVGAADTATGEQIRTGIKQAIARIPAMLRTKANVRVAVTSTTWAILAALKYADNRSLVDDANVFDNCCTLVENSSVEEVGADKIVAVVYVKGRSYGLAINPNVVAGIETIQGEPQYWTREDVGGKIIDFTTIYAIFVPT